MNQAVALSETGNDRIVMGGNMSAFDEARQAVDDLFDEAQVWLTGEGVKSEAEAKAVETLLDLAREARKNTDEARKVEKLPFDEKVKEIQDRYNPVLKRADMIADTCKSVLQPYRDKLAREKAEKAEAARQEALALQEKASEAMRASRGNVAERVKAEEILAEANYASGFAVREARRAATGNGLRTTYRAVLDNGGLAAEHYWKARRGEFQAFLSELAAQDVRRGIRSIPGFNIVEETKAV
jgi:hypothetical protein